MATFSNKSKNIAFFVKEFSGKPLEAGGTDNIIYQYAKYNEEILNNKSYIICLNKQTLSTEFGIEDKRTTFTTFNSRFKMIEIKFIEAITDLIDRFHFDIFYTLDSGLDSVMMDFLEFQDKDIWKDCKTLHHCLYDTTESIHADITLAISDSLNTTHNTNAPVLPPISTKLHETRDSLRASHNIPEGALVFGRYGDRNGFNDPRAHDAIIHLLGPSSNHFYVILMNTECFYYHPNLIYIDIPETPENKQKFINSCDAMIDARVHTNPSMMYLDEYAASNKCVITNEKIPQELKDRLADAGCYPIEYNSKDSLVEICKTFVKQPTTSHNTKAAENVMKKCFQPIINMLYSPQVLLSNTPYIQYMDKQVFTNGKHQGLTYKEVRINHTDFFISLMNQSYANISQYHDFIQYCIEFMKIDFIYK